MVLRLFAPSSLPVLFQSESGVLFAVPTPSLLACFQTPEKAPKAERSSPIFVSQKVQLEQTEQEKNTIHGCLEDGC
jgi:hypothetical protein